MGIILKNFLLFFLLLLPLSACTSNPNLGNNPAHSQNLVINTKTSTDRNELTTQTAPAIPDNFLNQTLPGDDPVPFSMEINSKETIDFSLVFHPNLQEIYFARIIQGKPTIMVSKNISETWSSPQPVFFSGSFRDTSPCISSDGQRMFFSSDRPYDQGENQEAVFHIWYVERTDEEWGEPIPIVFPVNSIHGEAHPSLTTSDTLYFAANYPTLGGDGFYRSIWIDGKYNIPEIIPVPINQNGAIDVEPFISPDEKYLLFYSAGRPDNLTPQDMRGDLYIAKKNENGTWNEATNLGMPINSSSEESTPTLSHDGNYLFFASNRDQNFQLPDIYWVSFSSYH